MRDEELAKMVALFASGGLNYEQINRPEQLLPWGDDEPTV